MKHGMHNTRTYHAWEAMKARCMNHRNPAYKDYGGRGISVCERWMKFENFFADMGEVPRGLTLDRINNDGHYEPGNCRWASRTEQQGNRRVSKVIEFKGARKTVEQWAKLYGIGSGTLHNRLFQLGWDFERAISAPVRLIKRKSEWQTRQAI